MDIGIIKASLPVFLFDISGNIVKKKSHKELKHLQQSYDCIKGIFRSIQWDGRDPLGTAYHAASRFDLSFCKS